MQFEGFLSKSNQSYLIKSFTRWLILNYSSSGNLLSHTFQTVQIELNPIQSFTGLKLIWIYSLIYGARDALRFSRSVILSNLEKSERVASLMNKTVGPTV